MCGTYVDAKAKGLAASCKGAAKKAQHYGGAWGQLRKLCKAIHLRAGSAMPPPADELGKLYVPHHGTTGKYLNLAAYRMQADADSRTSATVATSASRTSVTEAAVTTTQASGRGASYCLNPF